MGLHIVQHDEEHAGPCWRAVTVMGSGLLVHFGYLGMHLDILVAALGLKSLHRVWLLCALEYLAGKPSGNLYRCIALDGYRAAVAASKRNWAWSMLRAVHATGYELSLRCEGMDVIDIPAFRQDIIQQRDSVWEDLDICPRTCHSKRSRFCTYARWVASPPHEHARSMLDIPVSAASMQRLQRFRTGCHHRPRDEGSWARPEVPRLHRVCHLCGAGTLGDERHLVFECPGFLCFREQWSHLFQGPQMMQAFMWPED